MPEEDTQEVSKRSTIDLMAHERMNIMTVMLVQLSIVAFNYTSQWRIQRIFWFKM